MRSGDAVAYALVNPGREDWVGMCADGIPLPAPDDDDASGSALREGRRDGSGASFRDYGSTISHGYSADASAGRSSGPRSPLTFGRGTGSTASGDTFDFSDSAAGSIGGASCFDAARLDDPRSERSLGRPPGFEQGPGRVQGGGRRHSSHVPMAAAMQAHGQILRSAATPRWIG